MISAFFRCFFFDFYILKVEKTNLVCITTKYPVFRTKSHKGKNLHKSGNDLRTEIKLF